MASLQAIFDSYTRLELLRPSNDNPVGHREKVENNEGMRKTSQADGMLNGVPIDE